MLDWKNSEGKCLIKNYMSTAEALWDEKGSKSQGLRTISDHYTDLRQSSLAVYNYVSAIEVES